jgi:hypothetical protein
MRTSFLTSILCLSFSISLSAQSYFPDATWQTKSQESVGLKANWIDSAVQFAQRNEVKIETDLRIANMKAYANEPGYKMIGPMKDRGKPAGMIIKNGYVVAQWGVLDRVDMTCSVTKSYLSAFAGLAIDDKLINNIDEPVRKYI